MLGTFSLSPQGSVISIYGGLRSCKQGKFCFESEKGSLQKISFGSRDIEVVRWSTVEEK